MSGARRVAGIVAAGMGILAGSASAQWAEVERGCDRDWDGWGRDRARACATFEAEFEAPGTLDVDGGQNGGVHIEGWDRDYVMVTAKVWAQDRDEDRAESLLDEVELTMRNGALDSRGPSTDGRASWGVSWEIMVPRSIDIEVETMNGGIDVSEVDGRIDFEALNGGVGLTRVSGDVRGRTTNGGLRVELEGDRWEGRGLDVETTNGGIELLVPEGYSADLETGTVNGGLDLDFPVTVQGRLGRRLNVTLGDGGPRVRVMTTNGGVEIKRARRSIR
ncbi:MAG: hypothetical protein AAF389_20925 [Gemmatimonadota bacterium]